MSAGQAREPAEGDGHPVADLDGPGEGYGFRKMSRAPGVAAFGAGSFPAP